MLEFTMESALPKLTDTSFFHKFDETTGLRNSIMTELSRQDLQVKSTDISDVIALMRLNGTAIVKKAIEAVEKGDIILLHNPEQSDIPPALPYIVTNKKTFIFTNRAVNNLHSAQETPKLMAVLEAAYLATILYAEPQKFLMNRSLMLILCNIYTRMITAPMESKLYIKGDHLTKAIIYSMAYFYKMIDGVDFNITPMIKKIVSDPVSPDVVKQIQDEVKHLESDSFMEVLALIKRLNPVRYKDLETLYLNHFKTTCGTSLLFAIENLSYLLILVTSANYKTALTSFSLNKIVGNYAKQAIRLLAPIV